MRIVAGTLRGRAIDAPLGEGTRPTIDRVREALFSSLYSLRGGFEGAVVLDAFAGSGALGIEAVSRGARQAIFYENDAKAAKVVKRNLEACGIVAPVIQRDILQAPPTNQNPPFDLVFLDPPYAYAPATVLGMVRALADSGALAPGAIIAYEHDMKTADDVAHAASDLGFDPKKSKKYGKTAVTIISAPRGA